MPGYFVNEISACVDESLTGYVRAHSHLELAGRAVISRSQVPSVAIVSGNGSGHEPAMVSRQEPMDVELRTTCRSALSVVDYSVLVSGDDAVVNERETDAFRSQASRARSLPRLHRRRSFG